MLLLKITEIWLVLAAVRGCSACAADVRSPAASGCRIESGMTEDGRREVVVAVPFWIAIVAGLVAFSLAMTIHPHPTPLPSRERGFENGLSGGLDGVRQRWGFGRAWPYSVGGWVKSGTGFI